MDSATGRRELWVDGAPLLQQDNLDWSGRKCKSILVGEGCGDHPWTGDLLFDDLRVTDGPPETTLVSRVKSGVGGSAGACIEMVAELFDGPRAVEAAPYAFDAVDTDSSGGAFYPSSTCTGAAVNRVSFVAGSSSSRPFFWEPAVSGTATVPWRGLMDLNAQLRQDHWAASGTAWVLISPFHDRRLRSVLLFLPSRRRLRKPSRGRRALCWAALGDHRGPRWTARNRFMHA